jgi:large subunit ribosomal protein L17
MLANMAASLIMHKRITTTTAKAKALRTYIEPLITKSKEDSTHSRRVVFSYLKDKEAVAELFRDVSPKIAERPGGYTRILKTGNRIGDNADMCIIELVDYNEAMLGGGEAAKTKGTRRRRSTRKKETPAATTAKTAKPKAEKAQKPAAPKTEESGEGAGEEADAEK